MSAACCTPSRGAVLNTQHALAPNEQVLGVHHVSIVHIHNVVVSKVTPLTHVQLIF